MLRSSWRRSASLLAYQVPVDDELMDQPLFSVESSDLDIGYLIHQLTVSKSRQCDMIRVWSGDGDSRARTRPSVI